MSFSAGDFAKLMSRLPLPQGVKAVAVGVSGGPDSMALCHMLSVWGQARNISVHAVTVDHGLRTEAAQEAKDVARVLSGWDNISHTILRWEGDKPESRILEEARAARYALIEGEMKKHGIGHLFVAHHQDDQAETFLIRLAKGSGLDGLAAMPEYQEKENGIVLCRPLLACSKEELILYCEAQGIPFVEDPTNDNSDYLRPRLRAARGVLEEEGLTSKRLAVTAARMSRARRALEHWTDEIFGKVLLEQEPDALRLDWAALSAQPEEIVLRVLMRCADILHPARDYAPRMEKMENLMGRILYDPEFRGATLGGCAFAPDTKNGALWIRKEIS